MTLKEKQLRIGMYAGTFDPVHAGHVGFALQALDAAKLDEVCFVPERRPRYKPGVEHYGHRVAMLRRALQPYQTLSLVELVDKQLTLTRTLPKIQNMFGDAKLVLLMGSDVFVNLPQWQGGQLLAELEFVISIRSVHEVSPVLQTIQQLGLPSSTITVVDSLQPELSSSQVRRAISLNQSVRGLLPSVQRYAARQWLYVQVPKKNTA